MEKDTRPNQAPVGVQCLSQGLLTHGENDNYTHTSRPTDAGFLT